MPERYGMPPGEAAKRAASGEVRAVARIISALEDDAAWGREAARALLGRARTAAPSAAAAAAAPTASPPRSRVIGVTGPPGSGKSSLVDRLIAASRARLKRVGVLAVDPSSPFSGGALLGDRIRMRSGSDDEGVYIRSLASRGRLGGLSPATGAAARVLEAAGFEEIFVETAGVGQSEVDVAGLADLVVVVCVPGLGDDIQAIKAGIMEIGDLFVVNKADRDGADRVVGELREAFEGGAAPVLAASAETGAGLIELVGAIDERYAELLASGEIAARRARADARALSQFV
jgi:LAO/AO transport system kinase